MSVWRAWREGVLCAKYPQRLAARTPEGRTLIEMTWRGDRAGVLAFAQHLAVLTPATRVVVVYRAYEWDQRDRRHTVEREMAFSEEITALLDEEHVKQARRAAVQAKRVNWRATPR